MFKCVNSTVKPFLMKKLLKTKVCGSREQCTGALYKGEKSTTYTAKKKKKKNAESCKRKRTNMLSKPGLREPRKKI